LKNTKTKTLDSSIATWSTAYNIRIGNSWADVHFISSLFVIEQRFRAENTLLSNRIKISTFCSFTGRQHNTFKNLRWINYFLFW
jgi:hypothetical protein